MAKQQATGSAATPPQTRQTAQRPAATQQAATPPQTAPTQSTGTELARNPATSPTALAKVAGAIQPIDISSWALAIPSDQDATIMEAIKENLGNTQLRAFDFERIKVPAGGALAWTVANAETGRNEPKTEIVGIPIFWKDQKAFWAKALDEAGAVKGPPDCSSVDMARGFGDPGNMSDGTKRARKAPDGSSYLCSTCHNNKFNTAKNSTGRGKACKDVRLMFVLREEDLLPVLIPIPPTSIAIIQQFLIKLTGRRLMYYNCVLKFTLVEDANAAGIKYSKVSVSLVGALPKEQRAIARDYNNAFRKMMGEGEGLPLLVQSSDITGETIEGTIVETPVDGMGGADEPGNEAVDEETGELQQTAVGDASDTNAV